MNKLKAAFFVVLIIALVWILATVTTGDMSCGTRSTVDVPPRPLPDSSAWVRQRGDTAVEIPGLNECVVCVRDREKLNEKSDTLFALYHTRLDKDNYYVNALGKGSLWFDDCKPIACSLTTIKMP
jgi:hypothetical protein